MRQKFPSIKEGVFTNLYGSTEANGVISYCNEKDLKTCYIDVSESELGKIRYTYDHKTFYELIDGVVTEIDIPEEFLGYRIIKMTLQPVVENALYHGIKNKRGGGVIKVSGKSAGKDIVLTVEDNGIGMNGEELARLRGLISGDIVLDDKRGFGMANVQQRITMHFGGGYGISVDSTAGEGTILTVRIPKV